MSWRAVALRRLMTATGGAWGEEPEDGEMTARCVRGTDFDSARLRINFATAPLRGFTLREFSTRRLLPGDMIIEKSGGGENQPVGRVVLFSGEEAAMPTNFAARLRPTAESEPRFLCYLMSSLYSNGRTRAAIKQTTGIQNLEIDALLAQQVAIPEHRQQRAIADFLDAETARIDTLITKKTQLADAIRRRHCAWVERVLLDEATEVVPLHYLTDPRRPIVYGIVQAGPHVSDGIPYIKSGDVSQFDVENLSRTSKEIDEQYSRARVHPGDIVMAMRASIGKVIMVPHCLHSANLTQGTARIAANHRVNPRWLLEVLRTNYVQEQCQLRAVGTTFKTLNIWDLRRILVPRAPSATQRQLAERIGDVAATLERVLRHLNRQLALLRQHRESVITAAVTGELTIPDSPHD